MTKTEFEKHLVSYKLIQEELDKFADDYMKNMITDNRIYLESVEMEGDRIVIETEASYCSCCGPDRDYISFPLEYIYNPNWVEIERDRQEKEMLDKAKKKAKAKRDQDKKDKINKEIGEKKLLEKLKEKYE